MNGDTRSCVDQILNAIEYGRLSIEETERRVQKLLDNEIGKTAEAADMDMVNACQSLLWELKTHGQIPYEDHSERIRAAVEKEYSTWTRHRRRQQLALKLGSIAAVFLLIVGISVSLHWEWFSGNSTSDGQQYMVQGREITLQMIESAIAEHDEFATFTVDNVSQLEQYLGFDPLIPSELQNGLSMKRCNIAFFPEEILVGISYMRDMDESYGLTLTVDYYTDMSNAFMNIEQNEEGGYVTIEGVPVYISKNINETVACWQEGNAVYSLFISALLKDYESIITEFLGGN